MDVVPHHETLIKIKSCTVQERERERDKELTKSAYKQRMKEENDVAAAVDSVVVVAAAVAAAVVVVVGWLRPMRSNLLRQQRHDGGLQGYRP